MELYINLCNKKNYIVFCSGILFNIWKLEIYFALIYFGMY